MHTNATLVSSFAIVACLLSVESAAMSQPFDTNSTNVPMNVATASTIDAERAKLDSAIREVLGLPREHP